MRIWSVTVTLLLATRIARADADGAQQLAEAHTRIARDAARGGHCDVVHEIEPKIAALDATAHAGFLADPLIETCYASEAPVVAPALLVPPAPAAARDGTIAPAPLARVSPLAEPSRSDTPPLTGGRLLGQVLLGTGVGVGGAGLGFSAGVRGCKGDGLECLGPALVGVYVGGVLGISIGVYAAGSFGDQTGSYGATLGCTVVGSLVGLAGQSGAAMVMGALGGAMICFNLSRRYEARRPTTTAGSLVRVDGDRIGLGVPLVTRGEAHGATVTNVPLVSGAF